MLLVLHEKIHPFGWSSKLFRRFFGGLKKKKFESMDNLAVDNI
jgi:hypothetical protein